MYESWHSWIWFFDAHYTRLSRLSGNRKKKNLGRLKKTIPNFLCYVWFMFLSCMHHFFQNILFMHCGNTFSTCPNKLRRWTLSSVQTDCIQICRWQWSSSINSFRITLKRRENALQKALKNVEKTFHLKHFCYQFCYRFVFSAIYIYWEVDKRT